MKLAFFSDIHANLPALEAFFEDIEKIAPDIIYCLGDLVGYCTWPNEVVEAIRKRRIPAIMGNHDEAQMFAFTDQETRTNRGITHELLTKEDVDYLINLPRHITLDFETKHGSFRIKGVHGNQKAIDDYLRIDYPEKEIIDMMNSDNTDLVLCGHTHKPYHRVIETNNRFKHIVNIGSVGKPKDGDQRGCYALVSFDDSLDSQLANSLQIEFRRFKYDIEKATNTIKNSDFPNSYAAALLNAN